VKKNNLDVDSKNNKGIEVASSSRTKSERGLIKHEEGNSKSRMKKEGSKQIEKDERSVSHRAPPGFESRKPPGFENHRPPGFESQTHQNVDKKVKPPPGFT